MLSNNIVIVGIGLILAYLITKFVVKTLIRIVLLVVVVLATFYLLYHFNIDLPPAIENTMESIDSKL